MTVPCRSLRAQHRRPARLLQALAKGVAWRVGIAYPARPDPRGEVPEWSNGAVSKTVDPSRGPRVRIPVSPPDNSPNHLTILYLFGFSVDQTLNRALFCIMLVMYGREA